jgi:hypothetical protein
MDTKTRAEKIAYEEIPNRCWKKWGAEEQDNLIQKITAHLDEAVREAHTDWLKDQCLDDVAKRAYAEGFAAARE